MEPIALVRISPTGAWHRRRSQHWTGCGIAIVGMHTTKDLRPGENDLCPACFDQDEIDTARITKVQLEHSRETGDLYYAPDEEPTDPNGHVAITFTPPSGSPKGTRKPD
jgi:hypothetical protein